MLENFFNPKKIAVIGASRKKDKIGNIILKNLLEKKFKIYPVNPNSKKILGKKCYSDISEIKEKIDLAIIATPANTVQEILEKAGEKKIKNIIIISSGFKEIGNTKIENDLKKTIKKYSLKVIGPNCLGIFDSYSGIDTLFMKKERLHRPKKGAISFISQSGALGGAVLDYASKKNIGFSKFISYGNAVDIDETDILEYLGKDKNTAVICMYVEQVKRGKNFIEASKKIKKPIIFLKGGTTNSGKKAALSHTGSLAGDSEIYSGALRQAGCIQIKKIKEMFILAEILTKIKKSPKGKRIQIITNGGGYGINAADLLENAGLKLAEPDKKEYEKFKKEYPRITISNPLDILGDSRNETYNQAIKSCIKDKNNDLILVLMLTQVPLIDEKITEILIKNSKEKPIIFAVLGSGLAEKISTKLKEKNIPCYELIEESVIAIKGMMDAGKK
jgi:acetate---CoA ligase (ADP-forming)